MQNVHTTAGKATSERGLTVFQGCGFRALFTTMDILQQFCAHGAALAERTMCLKTTDQWLSRKFLAPPFEGTLGDLSSSAKGQTL